jgi:hypothetical protein
MATVRVLRAYLQLLIDLVLSSCLPERVLPRSGVVSATTLSMIEAAASEACGIEFPGRVVLLVLLVSGATL